MSCEQTTQARETCYEAYCELLDSNSDFKFAISCNLFSGLDQWREKENGENDDAYDNIFDHLWEWDSEGMCHDIENCMIRYLMKRKGL